MTNFRCIDGPFEGFAFTDEISFRHGDVVAFGGVHYYNAGLDGAVRMLSIDRPEGQVLPYSVLSAQERIERDREIADRRRMSLPIRMSFLS